MRVNHILAAAVLLAVGSMAHADIIGCTIDPDGDGAIMMNSKTWDDATYEWDCNETQHWWPAHMLGTFTTDTETDPTVWVRNEILNDGEMEPLTWTDFHINITMNKPFEILAAATLPDWTSSFIQPTQAGPGDPWIGTVDYLAGTPVHVGDWGQFDVKFSFLGSVSYTMELIPTPEPATLSLLMLASLALLRRR